MNHFQSAHTAGMASQSSSQALYQSALFQWTGSLNHDTGPKRGIQLTAWTDFTGKGFVMVSHVSKPHRWIQCVLTVN